MATYAQNGITFGNVKVAGSKIEASPVWNGQTGVDDFGGIINATDIDWCGAKVGEKTINSLERSK